MRSLIFSSCLLVFAATILPAQQYDLVLEGGRVMDPETNLDVVRNVGIREGEIARSSPEPLNGRRVVNARGLVVAPGFIDLHQHGQDLASQRVKALDGVNARGQYRSDQSRQKLRRKAGWRLTAICGHLHRGRNQEVFRPFAIAQSV